MFLLVVLAAEPLFKGYHPKIPRVEEGEIDSRSFDERSSRWKKLFEGTKGFSTPLLFRSLSRLSLSQICQTTHSAAGVTLSALSRKPKLVFVFDAACLSLPIAPVFTPIFFFLSLNTCVQTADQPEPRIPRQPFNIERCETWWKEKENKWDVIFNVKHQMWAFIISHLPPPPLSCLAAVTLAVLLGATPCQVEFRDSDTVSSNPSSGLSVSPGEKNGEGDGRKRRERQAERREATDRENLGARSKEDFAFCSTVTRVWLEFKVWLYKTERLNPRRDPNTPLAPTTYGAFKRKVNYSRA